MSTAVWQHALITGASSGIGEAFAHQLAHQCHAVTLVARRGDRLRALAGELSTDCTVRVLEADLTDLEGMARVVEHIRQHDPVDLLLNNAGFSTLGPFRNANIDRELDMIRLHQHAPLQLIRAVLPAMCDAHRGAIINVASLGAYLQLPGVATYAATKAFLVNFSLSLQAELEGSGVFVQCLCPGYTHTEIHEQQEFAGFDKGRIPAELWMDADAVVGESLAALTDGNRSVLLVPGDGNRTLLRESLDALRASLAE